MHSNFCTFHRDVTQKISKSQHMSVIDGVVQTPVANYLFCNNKNLLKQLKLCRKKPCSIQNVFFMLQTAAQHS